MGRMYDAFARLMNPVFRRADDLGKLRAQGGLEARMEVELARALGLEAKVQELEASVDNDSDQAAGMDTAPDADVSFALKLQNRVDLPSLVKEAGNPGNSPMWAETHLPEAQRKLMERALGHSLEGYIRAVDLSGLRHVDKRHGSRSNDPFQVTEADLTALPEIVAAPGAMSVAPSSGKNVTTVQHVRHYNGAWYYYTEEVRGGKNGQKALVLVGLRKAAEKKWPHQTNSAEAGSVTSETLLVEAAERLSRSNESFKHNREESGSGPGGLLKGAEETHEIFVDELPVAGPQAEVGNGPLESRHPDQTGEAEVDISSDVGEVSFSLQPDAVGRWVNKQVPVTPPVVKLPFGGEAQLLAFARSLWTKLPPTVQTRDGRTVTLKHNLQGTEEVLFEHLTTSHDATGRSWVDRGRIQSLLRIPSTIENARPRFIGKNGNHIYIQRYSDDRNHYVVTRPDGVVTQHGIADALTSQWLRPLIDDRYLEVERLEFNNPSSAQSEQGRATGTTSTSPSQSNVAPGMPGEARPVAEGTVDKPQSQGDGRAG